MASDPILRLRNIFLEFGGPDHRIKILKGIDLDISRGSSVAILGPSGSGKSEMDFRSRLQDDGI